MKAIGSDSWIALVVVLALVAAMLIFDNGMPENFDWWLVMMTADVGRWTVGLIVALYGGHVFARLAMWHHWRPVEEQEERLDW